MSDIKTNEMTDINYNNSSSSSSIITTKNNNNNDNNSDDDDVIKANDYIVIRMHDDKSTSVIKIVGDQRIARTRVNVKPLIGHRYGTVFEIVNKRIVKLDNPELFESLMDEYNDNSNNNNVSGNDEDMRGDNSFYTDTNTSQKLKNKDVEQLKDAGISGVEIVKQLIANNSTWNVKTEFAQEKWLKRKQKKYVKRFRVIKCTPATLCEVYHGKSRDKICGIRWDVLAQVLSQSSIHAGCRALIFDGVIGLMVGCAAYRMRGHGRILALYSGQQPHFDIVDALNLDLNSCSIVQPIPCNELGPAAKDVETNGFSITIPTTSSSNELDQNIKLKPHQASGRIAEDLERSRIALREGADRLIIACRFQPLPILQEALKLLAPSSPFVVYCEFMEPLVECYVYLQQNNLALRLTLSDTWMREFQTLPGRVHPQMFMPVSGGYLLSGIYYKDSP